VFSVESQAEWFEKMEVEVEQEFEVVENLQVQDKSNQEHLEV